MSEDEIAELVNFLAENPDAGNLIPGTGGCRKVRVAGNGRGKSGGFRTITFFSGTVIPVFLLTVFSKGERSNLTKEECNALGKLTKLILTEYSKKVVKVQRGR